MKNLLVFFPFIFSCQLSAWGVALLAFFSFSFAASGVYVINDLCDAEADRSHPTKCTRPIASGAISKRLAIVVALLLYASSIIIAIFFAKLPILGLVYLLLYIGLNLAYSFKLKQVPILDVVIVAAGFLLRVLFGGAFGDIWISPWLFLTVLSFALYFALGKRRGEIQKVGSGSRPVLAGYNRSFLDKNMYVFLACGLVYYSLWVLTWNDTLSIALLAGVPLAMIACMRYSLIIESDTSDGDPMGVVLSDKLLLLLIVMWVISVVVPLYLP